MAMNAEKIWLIGASSFGKFSPLMNGGWFFPHRLADSEEFSEDFWRGLGAIVCRSYDEAIPIAVRYGGVPRSVLVLPPVVRLEAE